jgi:hypothetical protein
MSPSRSKTTSRPSGLTSTDIQVPVAVSMLTVFFGPGGLLTSHLGLGGAASGVAAGSGRGGVFAGSASRLSCTPSAGRECGSGPWVGSGAGAGAGEGGVCASAEVERSRAARPATAVQFIEASRRPHARTHV